MLDTRLMKPFFIDIPNFWAWPGQTIWADKFWGIWGTLGQFISTPFGTVSPCFLFSTIISTKSQAFISKSYSFGIGILIWAAKNKGFSHHVSVVRGANDENCLLSNLDAGESQYSL